MCFEVISPVPFVNRAFAIWKTFLRTFGIKWLWGACPNLRKFVSYNKTIDSNTDACHTNFIMDRFIDNTTGRNSSYLA